MGRRGLQHGGHGRPRRDLPHGPGSPARAHARAVPLHLLLPVRLALALGVLLLVML